MMINSAKQGSIDEQTLGLLDQLLTRAYQLAHYGTKKKLQSVAMSGPQESDDSATGSRVLERVCSTYQKRFKSLPPLKVRVIETQKHDLDFYENRNYKMDVHLGDHLMLSVTTTGGRPRSVDVKVRDRGIWEQNIIYAFVDEYVKNRGDKPPKYKPVPGLTLL